VRIGHESLSIFVRLRLEIYQVFSTPAWLFSDIAALFDSSRKQSSLIALPAVEKKDPSRVFFFVHPIQRCSNFYCKNVNHNITKCIRPKNTETLASTAQIFSPVYFSADKYIPLKTKTMYTVYSNIVGIKSKLLRKIASTTIGTSIPKTQ
jgi:hypothetical protein